MNKRIKPWLLAILPALFFVQCVSHKVTYSIPADYPEVRRQEIIGLFKKGKELFKINCSECHGIFTNGRDSIPNFTNEQIDNYSAKFLRHDPKSHAVTKKMSPEQLNEVLMFLRYRKIDKKTS